MKGHFVSEVEGCLESREHKKENQGELGRTHERTRSQYSLHNQSMKDTEEEKGRHKFQQFEIEETV